MGEKVVVGGEGVVRGEGSTQARIRHGGVALNGNPFDEETSDVLFGHRTLAGLGLKR
jgi:hypothetical protein